MNVQEVKKLLDTAITLVEMERFLMGMGKYEFAKHLGIAYHTYHSFINQKCMTHPKTVMRVMDFLIEERGKDFSLFYRG